MAEALGPSAPPWIDKEGRWPLPWLEPAWAHAARQRGHAILLHGAHGHGIFELAMVTAQGWLCEDRTAQPALGLGDQQRMACGNCGSCALLSAGTHPDFMLLVPEALRSGLGVDWLAEDSESSASGPSVKSKASGREIRVADIRKAIDWAHQTSSRGRAKVILVHPAQALNQVAANAMLKTLEEPAGSLRVVMTASDPSLLLPTLVSRCQMVACPAPTTAQALEWLCASGVTENADLLLQAAAGQPQLALELDREGLGARWWAELPSAVRRGASESLVGVPIPRLVDALQKLCLDLMSRAHGAAPSYFPAESLPPGAKASELAQWWQSLLRTARHQDHPWNSPLLVESLVLQARRCWPSTPASTRRVGAPGASSPRAAEQARG